MCKIKVSKSLAQGIFTLTSKKQIEIRINDDDFFKSDINRDFKSAKISVCSSLILIFPKKIKN
jgi:hypothetical protein